LQCALVDIDAARWQRLVGVLCRTTTRGKPEHQQGGDAQASKRAATLAQR
jgi:hypothetical protein